MDSGDLKENGKNTGRRSARLASKTELGTSNIMHRPPIKRSRKRMEEESTVINGFKGDCSSEKVEIDGESPEKIPKLEEENNGDKNGSGDGYNIEMEEESKLDKMVIGEAEEDDQEMYSEDETEEDVKPNFQVLSMTEGSVAFSTYGNVQKLPTPGQRKSIQEQFVKPQTNSENFRPNLSAKDLSYLAATTLENQQGTSRRRVGVNTNQKILKDTSHVEKWTRPQPQKIAYQTCHTSTKKNICHKKSVDNLQKMVMSQSKPASSSKGCWRYLLWCLLLMGLVTLCVLAFEKCKHSNSAHTDVSHSETMEKLDRDLSALQTRFLGQRSEFWKRIGKHLKRHLQTVNPTEPVSVVLTAGLQAERTLSCLARNLATAFHNASILEINGTTKRSLDSDVVKLEVDQALMEAFENDKHAAVVHHFDELPPGSTLIFYRYCDHENAAYKNIFLVFTIILSVEEIDPQSSLKALEEMVFDHVKTKFISSGKSAMYNQMDPDKFSGLWSRISHVILPVNAEKDIEQKVCEV